MKKYLDVISTVCAVILLIWISASATALMIARDSDYYKKELRECGVYSTKNENGTERRRIIYSIGGDPKKQATLSDEQLDLVADHIVDYLFGDTESFDLKLDAITYVNGDIGYNVSLFGDRAISHMRDVKVLMKGVGISLVPCAAAFIALLIYILKKVEAQKVLKYTFVFIAAILVIAALFCLWSLLGASENNPFLLNLWGNLHYVLFAFSSDAYQGSFLNDALVYILTLEFFLGAVALVLSAIGIALLLWIAVFFLLAKKGNRSPKSEKASLLS